MRPHQRCECSDGSSTREVGAPIAEFARNAVERRIEDRTSRAKHTVGFRREARDVYALTDYREFDRSIALARL